MTLTGTQIETVLEQQFCGVNDTSFRVLLPSALFHYTWDASQAALVDPGCTGDVVSGITLNGQPLVPGTPYRVTVNSFLADGGDGFSVDTDAFEAYLTANTPPGLSPPATNRIDRVD